MSAIHRGFTLIELLVVIAIIGILSATVLSATTTSRGRANEASVKMQLRNIQIQAEHYFITNTYSYNTQSFSSGAASGCTSGVFSDTKISDSMSAADTANGSSLSVLCYATGSDYVAGAALSSSQWWCVDGATKSAKLETTAFPTPGSPLTTAKCP